MAKKRSDILLECSDPLIARIGVALLWILVFWIIPVFNSGPVGWLLWAFLVILSFERWPNLTIREDGLETRFFWKTEFIRWEDISKVRDMGLYTYIYLNKRRFLPKLVIMGWNRNYRDALQILKQKTRF